MKHSVQNLRNRSGGFSLVELMVVVAIFVIITSVVLYNQNKFSSDISISNSAYAVALEIRKAQVYGILVRENYGGFNDAYGIHFKNIGGVTTFDLFSDDNKNLSFDVPSEVDPGDTVISSHALTEGNTIADVCTYDDALGSGEQCFSFTDSNGITTADIVFKRPDPAAIITNSLSVDDRKSEVIITIQSSLGDKLRTVKVFGSGQISVISP